MKENSWYTQSYTYTPTRCDSLAASNNKSQSEMAYAL